ncbi:MAG: hypothetical protein H6656_13730 [Ardenticatenaceae bacterium]|nr:hypothetical protein [Ardenticatenaceae bacterium]
MARRLVFNFQQRRGGQVQADPFIPRCALAIQQKEAQPKRRQQNVSQQERPPLPFAHRAITSSGKRQHKLVASGNVCPSSAKWAGVTNNIGAYSPSTI